MGHFERHAQQQVCMVTPAELKGSKRPQSKDQAVAAHSGDDPWDVNDPWLQGRRASNDKAADNPQHLEALEVMLIPGYFSNEDGSDPEVISGISNGARGVCLLQADRLATLAVRQSAVSPHECAAVIIGGIECSSGVFPVTHTSIVVEHVTAGKILLKGTLINFSTKHITVRKSQHAFELRPKESKIITLEITRAQCEDWDLAVSNPVRYV